MSNQVVKGFNVNGSTVQYDYESLSDRLLKSSIGEIYSSSNTYKVDEYVLYAGQLYRCIVEVTTPQNFDSSKWEAVSVGDDLKYIKKYYCIDDGIKQALLNLLSHVAYTDEHGQDYYDELEAELFRTADLVSISAVFNQGQNIIYDTDSLDTLRQYLVVTATYDDSSTGTVTGYTLSGTLTVGTSTITVSYGGKTATFDVMVTEYVPQGWLYHFEDTLASSGTKDFNFTGVAAYGTGPTGRGKAYYHHVGTEGTASTDPLGIYATGLTDIPDLSGDFTISFWAKAVTATSSHPLVANKYYSDGQVTGVQDLPTNVADGWNVGQGSNTALKYRGVRFIYITGKLFITLHATDNSVIDYMHTLPTGTVTTIWHHYALTRGNGVLRFFFDGAQVWSINYTKAIVFANQICIGNNWGTTAATATQPTQNGASDYVDDLYIAEFCKWDSNFDPSAITY